MLNLIHRQANTSLRRKVFPLVILISLLTVSGCGTINYKTGKNFEPSLLESRLISGVSNCAQVQKTLGTPFGKGLALMPYHASPRTIWTYYFDEGSLNLSGGDNTDKQKLLFVFLDGDTYEGYMWFDSQLHSID